MTKPERAITFGIVGILLFIAAAIVWQNNKPVDPLAQAFRDAQPPKIGWFSSSAKHRVSTRTRQQQVDDLYQLIVARHPELAITWKNVPDDKNGFLQWLELSKRHHEELVIPDDIKKMLNPSEKWDGERIGQWLTENKALLDEITAIGLLPDQSAHHVELPPGGIINARFFKECADLLCLQSRWQATQGSSDDAQRTLQASMGLANHLDQIETPCLMNVAVSTLIRLTAQGQFFHGTLPDLATGTDLTPWQQKLQWTQLSPQEHARFLNGEWHVSLRNFLPELMTNDPEVPDDPERFIDAWADHTKKYMDACATSDWQDLPNRMSASFPAPADLSPAGVQLLDTLRIGSAAYAKALARADSTQTLQSAAFAHLRGEPVPNEPITGLPYIWDASNKTLSAPNDPRLNEMKLKPIKLPR